MTAVSASESRALRALRRTGAELLPIAVLVGICCLFFWRALSLQGVFFHYDHALQNFPYRLFFARGLVEGHLNLWTPDLFCGFPLFAESQGNALYPPFLLLFRFLTPWVAYNYYTVLHFALAGFFMYLLARLLDIGRLGAMLAGVCYMLGGPIVAHAHHTNIVVGICWLPALLALIELACRRRSLLALCGFAAATGMLVLGAQPQYTLYCGLVCGIYLIWRLRILEVDGAPVRQVAGTLLGVGAAGALGGLLAAGQLLPLVELVSHTTRAIGAGGLGPASPGVPGNLMTVLLPHYFGSPGLASYWGSAEPGLYSELTLYCGAAPLMLAVFAVYSDRSRRTLFFAALGAFSFVFALGYSGAIYNLFALMPVFSASRFASRFAFVTMLCVALLAGTGLERLLRTQPDRAKEKGAFVAAGLVGVLAAGALVIAYAANRRFALLDREALAAAFPVGRAGVDVLWRHLHETLPRDACKLASAVAAGGALLMLGARGMIPKRLAVAVWVVVVAAELGFSARDSNAVTSPAIYLSTPPLAARIRELPEMGEPPNARVFLYGIYDASDQQRRPGLFPFSRGWALEPWLYGRSLDRLPHNAGMIWGVPTVGGFSPLQTRALKTLLGRPDAQQTVIQFTPSRTLDLLAARYIVSPFQALGAPYERFDRVGDLVIWRNPNAMPRAFIVHRALPVAGEDAAVGLLQANDFDYAETVLLHERSAKPVPDQQGLMDADETARVTADTGDVVTVKAELGRPGYLVLADQWYPGWQVTVDARPARLLRLDYLLKGVRLQPGTHRVEFAFRPPSVRLGLTVSAAALAVLVLAVIAAVYQGRRRGAQAGNESRLYVGYEIRTARMVALTAVVFLLLGPLLHRSSWRMLPLQIDPRHYVVSCALTDSAAHKAAGRYERSYRTVLESAKWWPANPQLRAVAVVRADELVRQLLLAERREDAREVAREITRTFPAETRAIAPGLFGVADHD
jgi:hypothetical protein